MQAKYGIDKWIMVFKKINFWLLIIPGISLGVMFFLDSANVITIRLFGVRATPIQKELIEQLIVVVVYLGLSYVLIGPGHIKTEILKNKFGKHLRFTADIISDLSLIFLSLFCIVSTGAGALHNIEVGRRSMGYIEIPLGPFFLTVTIGWLLLSIAAILVMIRHCVYYANGEYDKEKEAPVIEVDKLVKA